MSRPLILAWVLSVCPALRRSQAKTLGELVAAAVPTDRATLANLGRAMPGPARCKHRIKRAARFVANPRVAVADGMAGVIARLSRRRVPLVVALDWVEVRAFHTLVAAAVAGGRSVPLLWASYPEWELHKSQNNLEEGLVRLLRALVPDRVRLILLADRGFGRAELARALLGLVNVSFVIRVKPQVVIRHPAFTGKLIDYPVRKGMRRVLRGVQFRATDPVGVNVVIRWKRGLPDHRDGPWFLVTDLGKASAVRLTELYGRRMGVDIDHPDHHPSNRVSATRRFLTIGVSALLALARWCRQQIASPGGGASGPAAAPAQHPPAAAGTDTPAADTDLGGPARRSPTGSRPGPRAGRRPTTASPATDGGEQ